MSFKYSKVFNVFCIERVPSRNVDRRLIFCSQNSSYASQKNLFIGPSSEIIWTDKNESLTLGKKI